MIWIVYALYYVVAAGGLGISSSLGLRNLRWHDLILWTGSGYVLLAVVLLLTHQTTAQITTGSWWAVLSAALVISGLLSLFIGLAHGSAAKVVTVGAAYPAVTVLLAALFLSEPLTVMHVLGVLLVVGGCVLIARS